MPVEIQVLAYAALLQYLQIFLFVVPANVQLGPKYTAGPLASAATTRSSGPKRDSIRRRTSQLGTYQSVGFGRSLVR